MTYAEGHIVQTCGNASREKGGLERQEPCATASLKTTSLYHLKRCEECFALVYCLIDTPQDDEIIVLLRIPARENTYLGSRHGTLGIFAGSNVEFLGPLKKPIKRLRVPTRLGNYAPSPQSSSYDSDASSGHPGRFPSGDSALSPTSPGWLMQHSPYLDERQRSLSASISAASTTDVENSPSLYEDYQRRRPMHLVDVLPHGTVRPWLSAVAQSIHSIDSNPSTRGGSHPSMYGTAHRVTMSSDSSPPRATYSDPQQPSPSTPSGLGHDQLRYSSSINTSVLRSGAMQEPASRSTSFPLSSSPLRPSFTATLHMPKPRMPARHRPSFLKNSFTSVVTNKSPLRGSGFADIPLVEDDDDTPPASGPAPTIVRATVYDAARVTKIIAHSPRPLSARDRTLLGSPSPRSPLSPISPNYPMSWSPGPGSVPIFSESPATSPAPHPAHRTSTISPRSRLASLSRRPRPSSRSGSGSTNCSDAENVPPVPHVSARRRTLTASESAHLTSSSSPLLRETLTMGASPSSPKPFRCADNNIRLSLDTRPPSSGRVSSGSGGRHSVSSSSRGPMSPSDSSDTAPDWRNLVYPSTESASELMTTPRRDDWVHPPLAPSRKSRLGFESIPEEDNLMQVDNEHGFSKRSLVINPLQFEFEQAARKRRKDVRRKATNSSLLLSFSITDMKWTVSEFIKNQWTTLPPVVQANLTGKTVIVTGANNGIGFEAAKHFARMAPGKLILACRSKERGQAALDKIKGETGCKTTELWILDLASFASVKAFAEKFNKEGGRLDILMENAAVTPLEPMRTTTDGWEETLQINNLSTSLLALLLLPRMIQTAKEHHTTPRMVIVSSEMHYMTQFEKELMESPNPLQTFGKSASYIEKVKGVRYEDSKLLNVFFTRSLAERLPLSEGKVIVNTVNPGYCYSGLRDNWTGLRKVFDRLMEKVLARTSEEGARQLVWAAVGGEDEPLDNMHGAYLSLAKFVEPSDYVLSVEGQQHANKIWDNLLDELRKVEPKVQNIMSECLQATPTAV
ncbi:hypothetical protein D9619_002190 [Psilocybe cf. subviscida]|uniref:NAD(P)-binding protein n=1 Tax=Psilocybe cf. subviscida TaxID=2480587 RepID=A0A8H5BFR3_9AGAR|nr:hypothetical protein D9619_002190 [Psilocybe cf. subviscida]